MKIEVKKIDATKRELRFEVPRERVAKVLGEVYDDLGKVAKIKGYRPGKAPRHVLEAHQGKVAKEETLKRLIPEAYREGLEKENISPLDLPEIFDVEFKDGVVTFAASLDIKPEIKLGNYKGITIKRKSSQVTEEEVNKTLEFIKKGQGQAGQEIALDDAFAHTHGYPTLEEFKKVLVRQMEIDKDRQNRIDVENQIMEELLNQTQLVVPQSLVNKQLEHRLAETKRRLQTQGVPEEKIKAKEEDLRKELQEAVEKDVKAYLIFDKIAQAQGITVPEGENMPNKVMELLLKEAKWE